VRAEVAKLRYLPLPRWTAAVAVAAPVIAGGFLFGFAPRSDDTYTNTMTIVLGLIVPIAGIVLGVWFAALEFASGTMQRTLTAEPNRNRVLASKLVVAIAFIAVVAVAASAAGGGIAHLATVRADVGLSQSDLARAVFSSIPDVLLSTAVGFGFGLLTRSMGGGVTLAIAFTFVLDGALTFVPWLKDYTFGQLTGDLTAHLSGDGATKHGAGVALLGAVIWLAIILTPGWISFVRGDLK
jgi:ABC-2 type transport system permease protein